MDQTEAEVKPLIVPRGDEFARDQYAYISTYVSGLFHGRKSLSVSVHNRCTNWFGSDIACDGWAYFSNTNYSVVLKEGTEDWYVMQDLPPVVIAGPLSDAHDALRMMEVLIRMCPNHKGALYPQPAQL